MTNPSRSEAQGDLHVHEFVTLDGVIDAPTWTFDYEFLPGMLEAIGAYDADRIRHLKDGVGDIYVSGSGTLVRALLADGGAAGR